MYPSDLTDDVNALYITGNDHYSIELARGKATSKYTGELNMDDGLLGPQTMLFDMWHIQGHDTFTHGGFVTHPYHTSSFTTYIYPRSGALLLGIMHTKRHSIPDDTDLTALWIIYDEMIDKDWNGEFKGSEMGTVLLEEGQVM